MNRLTRSVAALAAGVLLGAGLTSTGSPAGAVEPGADPFYTYSGATPLASFAPGAVLGTRSLQYSIAGAPTPFPVTQVLYRSTDQLGRPAAGVTSIIRPVLPGLGTGKLVSYQSFYDSLNPADSPSRGIAGALPSAGGAIVTAESALLLPLLLAGYTINFPDTEGQDADFAAGPEYGRMTLDSIRAASLAPGTGVPANAPVGMLGYSGGAIATGWAAALAPSYAPDVNSRLVGATEGGVLVAPARNLRYIDGAPLWGGVEGMALVGVARAFDIDFSRYLSDYGKEVFAKLQTASIGAVLGQYPDFRFARLVKPEYADPTSIREFVDASNALNLGSAPSPTIPMQVFQGAGGTTEGTPGGKPGIGPGDGVMIAGDVRSMARQWCASGTPVDYTQDDLLSHTPGATQWLPGAIAFLAARFAGAPVTSSCGRIAEGNSLAPEVYRGPAATPAGPSRTRVRVRLARVWQVRGREAAKVSFAVVSPTRPSAGSRAGRAVVRVDGRRVRTISVPVVAGTGRRITSAHVRLPRSLGYGRHVVQVVFRPTDRAAYAGSRSRAVRLDVVRTRPDAR